MTTKAQEAGALAGKIYAAWQRDERHLKWPLPYFWAELASRACLEAAAPPPPAGGWEKIESAPKDGTRILAWHKDWETSHTAQWYGSYWGVFYKTGPLLYQPTHWMPLPSPPIPDPGQQETENG